jgi:prepilin-type N-terminal cleavage/methylation domain-containing protein
VNDVEFRQESRDLSFFFFLYRNRPVRSDLRVGKPGGVDMKRPFKAGVSKGGFWSQVKRWRMAWKGAGSGRGAFTLIELLVVVAIIALLAALLLPTLGKAKESAQRIQCLSQLKQWGVAFHSYAHDNEGVMPREGYHTNGQVYLNTWAMVESRQAADVWYNALSNHVGNLSMSSYFKPLSHRLDFYRPASFFHCPGATRRFPPLVKNSYYQVVVFSMAMNSQLIQEEHGRFPTMNLDQVKDSRTVLFHDNLMENEARVDEYQMFIELGQPASYAPRFAGRRHGRGGNILFLNGNAETLRGEEVVETSGLLRGGPIVPPRKVVWDAESRY